MNTPDAPDIQRRHTRLKTRQIATLTFPDGSGLNCEIRDFSERGLNLFPLDATAAAHLPPAATAEAAIDAVLSIVLADRPQPYRLQGRLRQHENDGLGFQSEAMPAEVYQALHQARARLLAAESSHSGLLHEESISIQRDCVNLFRHFLEQAWGHFFMGVESTLLDRDTASLPLSDHSRYLNGLSDLLRRKQEISVRHFSILVEKMHHLGETEAGQEQAIGQTELSLLDDDSFEDWLNIAAVFNHLEADLRTGMFQFAQRFGHLSPVVIDRHNDPFGPETVCLAFRESLREMDFNSAMRKLLYKQFGAALAAGYGTLYDRFNQLLAPLKPVTPAARHRPVAPATVPSQPPGQPGSLPTREPAEADQQVSRLAEIAERLFALYPNVPASGLPATPPDITTAAAPAPQGGVEAGANIALPHILSLLEQTLHLFAQMPADSGRASMPATVTPPMLATPQLNALMAALPSASAMPPQTSLSDWMQTLLERADLAGQLPLPYREKMGAMTHLFGQAIAEHTPQSDIDVLLRKLERPLYEALLRGEDVLQPNHSLGRLFNLVDRLAVVADDQGRILDPVLKELSGSIIDQALAQAAAGPGAYEQACTSLEKLLKQPLRLRQQHVAAYQEACEGQERIRRARRKTAEALNARIANRRLPKPILQLLEQGWQHYLILLAARGDEAGWARGLDLLEELADRTELPGSAQNAAGTPANTWLDEIAGGLRQVNIDVPQRERFLQQFAVFLGTSPATTDSVQVPVDWFAAAKTAGKTQEPPTATLPAPLLLGDWWTIASDGQSVPMQLIWQSQPAATYAFVNRSATRKIDFSIAQFSGQLRSGAITPTESRDLPLLERSEYGIIDSLYRRLSDQACHDPVTGLLNRRGLEQALTQRLTPENGDAERYLCGILEFAPFQVILDNCGVAAGELLMRNLAAFIQPLVGPRDLLASFGDGVFALFLPNLDAEAGRRLASNLLNAMQGYHFRHAQQSFGIDINLGLANYQRGSLAPTEALRRAAAACATAKAQGRNRVEVYEDSDTRLQERESVMEWAGRIDAMLSDDVLYLRGQRITPLRESASLTPYYEILLGIRDDSGNPISPQAFIQAAEHWKRARDVDLWVIGRIFRWIRAHGEAFRALGGFSINLSAQSLADPEVLSTLQRELAGGDIPAEKIMFEITETATLSGYSCAQQFISQIRHYGCKFCIDDFGSGNASYNYLRNLKTDTLKIDGMFVKDMVDEPDLQAIVKSMNDIGHSLGMKTVAEFAATPGILTMLEALGVDYGQGYALHTPVALDELIAMA